MAADVCKALSGPELSVLISKKRAEIKKAGSESAGMFSLADLEKERDRRKSEKTGGVAIKKDSPMIGDALQAIKKAAEENKCGNIDVIKFCMRFLKTGFIATKKETKPRKTKGEESTTTPSSQEG